MPQRRTLKLSQEEEANLQEQRDHNPRPYVRERCAALVKIARVSTLGVAAWVVTEARPRHRLQLAEHL
jgi:hypothetical protein